MNRWLVVGISGVTCSGKTTLAKRLHKTFKNSIYINQDSYYLPPDDSRHTHITELNHHNWDIITSVDTGKMLEDILKVLKSSNNEKTEFCQNNNSETRLIILDGIFILNFKPIIKLCHLKYYLTLTKEQCWERRRIRSYIPPDVPGYFDMIVWPEYLKNKDEIMNNQELCESIVFIDGQLTQDEIFKKVFNGISKCLSNRNIVQ